MPPPTSPSRRPRLTNAYRQVQATRVPLSRFRGADHFGKAVQIVGTYRIANSGGVARRRSLCQANVSWCCHRRVKARHGMLRRVCLPEGSPSCVSSSGVPYAPGLLFFLCCLFKIFSSRRLKHSSKGTGAYDSRRWHLYREGCKCSWVKGGLSIAVLEENTE